VQRPFFSTPNSKAKPRKLLAQASRNGFYFLLDRTNGQHLATARSSTKPGHPALTQKAAPSQKPSATPSPDGALVEPGSDGSTNWMAPSFDPQTNLFYVNARRIFSIYYNTVDKTKPEGWAARSELVGQFHDSRARFKTGKVIWNHELGEDESIAGILTTAGHLLFTADTSHNLLALDPATGKTLWHLNMGGPSSPPP